MFSGMGADRPVAGFKEYSPVRKQEKTLQGTVKKHPPLVSDTFGGDQPGSLLGWLAADSSWHNSSRFTKKAFLVKKCDC